MALLSLSNGVASSITLLHAGATLACVAFAVSLYRGYQVRKKFRALQRQGIPIMKHSMILGHLESIGKIMGELPSDAHGDYLGIKIQEHWRELFPDCTKCPPIAYVDTWPFTAPMALSLNGELSAQFVSEHSMRKAPQQKDFLTPITKNRDLASMEGEEWKVWKKRLSPGFSIQNVVSRVPDIIEEVEDMVRVLETKAGKDGNWGQVFPFERLTTSLALDVALRFCLNKRFNEQWGEQSAFSKALRDTVSRMIFFVNITNIFSYLSPWRTYKLWKNYRTMANELTPLIKAGVTELNNNQKTLEKSFLPLILQGLKKGKGEPEDHAPLTLNAESLELAIGHIITFMFAGYDTTSVTIAWLFVLLEQHPQVMEKLRAEHDTILGPDAWNAAEIIKENPQLLNKLPYTAATIKESMRVQTNVGSVRVGEPGFYLVGPPGSGPGFEGRQLPTEGFVLFNASFAIHRDPDAWHRPKEFLPERFLVTDENDPLYPPPACWWRSFESGPRACIGQQLATTEIKIAAVLLSRCFDIECAWEEWDQVRGNTSKKSEVWGDRAYQIGSDSPPHIKDGMPVHVRVRA